MLVVEVDVIRLEVFQGILERLGYICRIRAGASEGVSWQATIAVLGANEDVLALVLIFGEPISD